MTWHHITRSATSSQSQCNVLLLLLSQSCCWLCPSNTVSAVSQMPKVFWSQLLLQTMAALTYSARMYDSAICCSKMSRDTFLSELLYEANKRLKSLVQCCGSGRVYKMADGAMVNRECLFYFVILCNMSINRLRLCLRLLCRLLHRCNPLSKYAARPWSANLQQ